MYPCDNYSTKVLIFFHFYAFAVFSGNYSCLQVALEWRRDLSQYWSDLFLPDMVLVATSFLTFWLDWSSVPARAILGMYYFIWTALFAKFTEITEFHSLKNRQKYAVVKFRYSEKATSVWFLSFGQSGECRNWCWMSNIWYCYLF